LSGEAATSAASDDDTDEESWTVGTASAAGAAWADGTAGVACAVVTFDDSDDVFDADLRRSSTLTGLA
jgi:hypothetical protein